MLNTFETTLLLTPLTLLMTALALAVNCFSRRFSLHERVHGGRCAGSDRRIPTPGRQQETRRLPSKTLQRKTGWIDSGSVGEATHKEKK